MPARPTPREAILELIESELADVHTSFPATVVSYDSARQTVDVKPGVKDFREKDDGTLVFFERPKLEDIPVAFPRGGGFHQTWPLAAGDFVTVVCSELDTLVWRVKGGQTSRPAYPDRHQVNGCFAFPGGYPDDRAIASAVTNGVAIQSDDAAAGIVVKSSEVLLGDNTATNFVALANLVDSIFTSIDTVFRTSWVPVAMDGGAALKAAWTAAFATPPSTVAATKTKAK